MKSLAEISGGRYRIVLDESWKAENADQRGDKVWYEQIPCKGGGFIGVYSLEPVFLKLYSPRPKNARVVWEAIKGIAGTGADFHGENSLLHRQGIVRMVGEAVRDKYPGQDHRNQGLPGKRKTHFK